VADSITNPMHLAISHRSPFEGHQPFERPSRDGHIGVRLRAGTISSVTQIATWHGGIDALARALGAALGVAVPEQTGDTVPLPGGLLVRSGPEEFFLGSEQGENMAAQLRQAIAPDIGSVTDLSHARCHIHIAGDRCCDALSKLYAIDLRDHEFPIEQVRLSGHHHVPSMLHRRARDAFDIYVFTTYAYDQLSALIDAALEYGVALDVSHTKRPGAKP
jgi:heterotetrameric sarcosine oxidase gamma subunit